MRDDLAGIADQRGEELVFNRGEVNFLTIWYVYVETKPIALGKTSQALRRGYSAIHVIENHSSTEWPRLADAELARGRVRRG